MATGKQNRQAQLSNPLVQTAFLLLNFIVLLKMSNIKLAFF